MIQPKLLLNLARDLRSLAASIQAVADTMTDNGPTEAAQPETPVSAKETEPKAKTVTLEEVRAVLADKSQQGHTAEVRMLLEKYGAPKLSQIDPANYAALLADAERLK
ncbi:putative secreted protein [Propionispora sp. 2/2-37]|jgi:hypothetical protein|uniref:rRNA biogenesis protein rrp5 n=1 Tax=Propionispora sp. 2/2-37 TaxID=1677858 RepID=UPI0006BB5AAE|nr:rRNA biogenesis protein rrp5 [Propionispora sp. 2/2-37]CUH96371.1 putative secreted protein [Propionispora sp. 2/2-37]